LGAAIGLVATLPASNLQPVGNRFERGAQLVGAVLNFSHNREIYAADDATNGFFKVKSGVVRTCAFLEGGRRQIAAFHASGDVFGFEMGGSRRFSAEAACDCTVIRCRLSCIDLLGADNDGSARQLLFYTMQSLARAQKHSILLGRCSALERVATFLTDWAARRPGDNLVTLAMTRVDIADYLCLTVETVSRTFSKLERYGLIDRPTARQIRLRNPAGLNALSA
jgi:CRP/FNR family transcriptional regulator, nitrogen fixation regulation protein